jgi:hypothetical protein
MEFESFYMEYTQGEVNHVDGQVPKPSVLDDLLGVSSTSMDVDPSSVLFEPFFLKVHEGSSGGEGNR